MKPSISEIQDLLATQRIERPEADYWDGFMRDFHQRRLAELAKKSFVSRCCDQAAALLGGLGPSRWAYGLGLAYACATIALLVFPKQPDAAAPATAPVNYKVIPAAQTARPVVAPTTNEPKAQEAEDTKKESEF